MLLAACRGGLTEVASTSTLAPPKPAATLSPTKTVVPDLSTPTQRPPTSTPIPIIIAEPFNITIFFLEGTRCFYEGFDLNYDVSVVADTITFHQLSNDLILPGSFDPYTGAFMAEVEIPRLGTEILAGTIELLDSKIVLEGEFSYFGDPNLPCGEIWPIMGEVSIR